MRVLVTGGARSGKSRHAQALAESLGPRRVYLATAEALDDEMADRIRRHQADRGPGWRTVEAPLDPAAHVRRADPDEVVLLDCLTLWVSNLMMARGLDTALEPDFERLCAAIHATPNPVVVVTNEVGLGIVPDNALARRFRDEAGRLNQAVAAACERVVLCVAGIPVNIK